MDFGTRELILGDSHTQPVLNAMYIIP